jgi:hypothetical protein
LKSSNIFYVLLVNKFKKKKKLKIRMSLETWYHVSFDENKVFRDVSPPGGEAWKDEFLWEDIIRICFKPSDFLSSDEIYIFTSERPESYLIPTEADGGSDLWGEIIERNFFDAELAIEAATSTEPEALYCWPKDE